MTPNRDQADLIDFGPGSDWDAGAHVRLLRENGGASSGYTADLIQNLHCQLSKLEAEAIIAPAECGPDCDDRDCPYSHTPLTLRQAYENSLSRTRDAESRLATTQSELDEARGALTGAARDVLAERRRQVEAEGWTPEHDDSHQDESLARAAACYAEPNPELVTPGWPGREKPRPVSWPRSWSASWWKPTDRRRDLVKAGSLILAEIDRLDRASLTRTAGGEDAQ